jgi:erythromycin esterase
MSGIKGFSDAQVFPLSTLDPAAALDDLEPLARLIGDHVRVVAVGESAHGAHEFYALRHRIIRFLVERMNFTALVWESGFPEGLMVDDFIIGRRQDRERVLIDGMTMHMGRCREMGEILDWLRGHNASRAGGSNSAEGAVRFYGLDLPGSSAALGPALDVVRSYVERVDPGFGPRLKRLLELAASFGPDPASTSTTSKLVLVGTAVIYQYVARPVADRNELTALLADLGVRFDALRRLYLERSDAEQYDVARQHLRVAAQLDVQLRAVAAFMTGDAAACEANIRDLTMADTVEWVLRGEERVIVLAHNGHVQRTPISTVPGMTPVDTLGVHLAHRLGERYLTIGTTCGGGDIIVPRTSTVDGKYETELIIKDLPPAGADTIDGLLDASLSGMGLLDLRTLGPRSAAAIDAAHRMRMLDQIMEIDVRRAFDMLIHVPRISLWHSEVNAALADTRGVSA